MSLKLLNPVFKKNLYVYKDNNEKDNDDKVLFEKVSKTAAELRLQMKYVLPFYIYVKPKEPDGIDYSEIRKRIGRNIGEKTCKKIGEYLRNLELLAE